MAKKLFVFLGIAVAVAAAGRCFAEELTVALVKQKVIEAAQLLEAEGRPAFAKLRDPKGAFRFADGEGYIWVHNMDGLMVVHPTKPELEGTPTLGMADSTGFRFIKAMNDLVSAQKQGWVAYLWPKPGTRTEAPKISFVKQVMIDGRPYVVGCGMYDVTPEAFRQKYPSETLVTSN